MQGIVVVVVAKLPWGNKRTRNPRARSHPEGKKKLVGDGQMTGGNKGSWDQNPHSLLGLQKKKDSRTKGTRNLCGIWKQTSASRS